MKLLTMAEIDLRKILPFIIGLFVTAIIGAQALFFMAITKLKESLEYAAAENQMLMEEYVASINKINLSTIVQTFSYPVLFMIVLGLILILSGFYLWYKDWFGTSRQIYTLLTLKGSRMRIFIAKLLVFLLLFLGYYGIHLVNLYLAGKMAGMLLPEGAMGENLVYSFMVNDSFSMYMIPNSLESLAFHLAFLVMMFSILSVSVLSDRSKRIWGLAFGLVYIIVSMYGFIYLYTLDFYTSELEAAQWLFVAIYLTVSLLISRFLLKKKVSI